ncbi:MAG: rhodanese-like domain-containing protein [Candidatus Thorarchaeota archaeon]
MVRSDGIAAHSYFVSSRGEAAVIDPRRDVGIYVSLSLRTGSEIRYIFETHRNEDLVTGSLELKHVFPSAEICHSRETDFKYGDHRLSDGDQFQIGDTDISCIWTPGHTDDSMCYLFGDSPSPQDAVALFTGDTLFVDGVGRTDLVDPAKAGLMADKLYDSLRRILDLPDGTLVYPGHGAGSVCGGGISDREVSTIGFERTHNRWLMLDRETFIRQKESERLTLAPYFKHCERLNTVGPPLLSQLGPVSVLDGHTVAKFAQEAGHVIVDVRPHEQFIWGHIPGSVSLPLGNLGLIAGWVLRPEERFILIPDATESFGAARARLVRLGLDGVIGVLPGGVDAWKLAGHRLDSLKAYSATELKSLVGSGAIQVADNREEHELAGGQIEGSRSVPLTRLVESMSRLDSGRPVATVCPSGARSTAAASMMRRLGLDDVGVLVGGLKGWIQMGYPLRGSAIQKE